MGYGNLTRGMNILIRADKKIHSSGEISSLHGGYIEDIHETIKGHNWLCTITDILSSINKSLIKHSHISTGDLGYYAN